MGLGVGSGFEVAREALVGDGMGAEELGLQSCRCRSVACSPRSNAAGHHHHCHHRPHHHSHHHSHPRHQPHLTPQNRTHARHTTLTAHLRLSPGAEAPTPYATTTYEDKALHRDVSQPGESGAQEEHRHEALFRAQHGGRPGALAGSEGWDGACGARADHEPAPPLPKHPQCLLRPGYHVPLKTLSVKQRASLRAYLGAAGAVAGGHERCPHLGLGGGCCGLMRGGVVRGVSQRPWIPDTT
eukprot:2540747-Rhodomonas_salina.1